MARLLVPAKRAAMALVVLTCACGAATANAATKPAPCHKRATHHGQPRCSHDSRPNRAQQVRLLVWELPVKDNRLTREEVHRLIAEARPVSESHGVPEGHAQAEGHSAPEGHRSAGGSESAQAKKEAAEAKKEAAEAKKEAEEEAAELAQEAAEEAAERAEELREKAKLHH